jgi:hypothetical protein
LGALGRLGSWLAALALAFQLLLPVAPVQAAAFDRDLVASICHSSPESDVPTPAKAVHDHCQLCQLHAGIKLLAPPALTGPALPRGVLFTVVPAADFIGIVHSVHLPQSQRGPPSHS